MPREKLCPKCGEDITETYEGEDPSVGIMSAGWYCEVCDESVPDDGDDYADDFDPRYTDP